mgnify:CR=1 FL=1
MIVTGEITLVGAGSWKNGENTASIIEIGGKKFRGIKYGDEMSTYLNKAYSNGSEATLIIVGVYLTYLYADGDECDATGSSIFYWFLILIGIPLLFVVFIGSVPISYGIIGLKSRSDHKKVKAMIAGRDK